MSTSLAEQLKRLAVPQTSLLKRDKKRASLLFNPKDAASYKRETVYQIGLDGLEELIQKNQVFEQFKNNLYDITSKTFERSVQSDEANKKLDKAIRKFLLLLSPYFLLNSSHKALEWLINRYNIHEFNKEDLLMLILPYHESNIFVRVVQLMKFKDQSDNWYFLKSLQKTGVHLPKQNLLSRAANDVYLLKFVSRYISLLIKEYEKPSLLTLPFNFYCTIFAGAIEYSHELNEAQITQMLPALIKGLNSDIPDYCAASYVILSRLVVKTVLTELILDKLVEKVSYVKVENLKTEAVLVLLVLYQSQYHYTKVPQEACANLVEKQWLPKVLQELNKGGCLISQFLAALIKTCVGLGLSEDGEKYRNLVCKLLEAIKLDETFVGTFLCSVLDAIKPKKGYSEDQRKWLSDVVETLERQYPSQFDKEVYKILSSTQEGKICKRKKSLQGILKNTMTIKGKFDVFDKLYHPNPQFRSEAIKYLAKNFDALRDSEKQMIKSSFIDRLNDENIAVIRETLSLIKNTSILNCDDLKPILIDLTRKCQRDIKTYNEISTDVVLLLCSISRSDDWETFLAVFPYLLPNNEQQLRRAKEIIKTNFIKQNSLLKSKQQDADECEQFCNNIFDNLKNENFELVRDFVSVIQKIPANKRDVLHKYLATLILSCILPENSSIEISVSVIDIFITYFKTSSVKYEKSNAFFQHHLNSARQGRFHIEGFLLCLKNVIAKTQVPDNNLILTDFSVENDFTRYFTLLINTLFNKEAPNYNKYAQSFLRHFCNDNKTKIPFLLNLILSQNKNFSDNFAVNCITSLVPIAENSSNDLSCLSKEEYFVPYLLALLLNKSQDVREKVLKIIEILTSVDKKAFYYSLLAGVLSQKEEIVLDEEQLPLVIFNTLSNPKLKKASSVQNSLVTAACNVNYPIYLREKLLKLLSHINEIAIFEKTSALALDLLRSNTNLNEIQSGVVAWNITRCEEVIAKDIKLNTNVWNFIETSLKADKVVLNLNAKATSLCVLILKQFTGDFLKNLEDDVQSKIFDVMIETATTTKNLDVSPATSHIFKHIDLNANLIVRHLVNMRDVNSPKLDPNKLKRRISVVPTGDILDTLQWRKGVTALEFIQDKKKIRNPEILVSVLFEVLKKCLDFDEQSSVEYPKQLILSSILHCCKKLDKEHIPENAFNIELIVQCIRASQNPQTHHHALLVLAYAALITPSQVLHHVMAIFTFMGSSVLRHDDAYSYQIIAKIIDTIVPLLVQDDTPETISRVLRVFVDALLDVPEHRRLPLYKQLLTKIGVKDNLYIFLLLIFESHVNHSNQRVKDKNEDSMKRLEIAASFCREFAPEVVIYTCTKLIERLKELPDEIEKDQKFFFDIHYKTPKQFRHFKYALVTFTANLLASREFVSQVAALSDEDLLRLEDLYKNFVINVLTYIQRVSKVAEKNVATPQAQYWKIILHHSYDILDSVNALLTPQMFLLVVKGLMLHSLSTVRRRALELLNSKLQHDSNFFDQCDSQEIYSLVPPMISIIKIIDESELESEQELIIQTALLSMKLLVKLLASEYPEKFAEILDFVTDLIKSGKAQNNVLASLVLCLAELCLNLRAHAISSLPNFMPALLKILRQQKHQESPSLLLLSSITAVQKILDTLALFLSPYLEKLLCELALLTSKFGCNINDQKLQPVVNKLMSVRQKIGVAIPSRVLIPVVEQSYNKLIEKSCYNAIGCLMDILAENLNNLKGPEINASLPELTNFFLNALQFRADNKTALDETNEVESQIVKALTKLILKLSESNFRPLYYKLFDWAVRGEAKSERLITFYSLSSGIAECLKGLFVLFAGHFLNNAAQILDACNSVKSDTLYFDDDKKTVLLLENVLKTLLAVFKYDNHRFINKDRFEVLMQPLVDQLENGLGGVESLERRNGVLVTPCIVQFAVATADDALWKQLNYQVLLKMRHSSPNIRLIALHCLTESIRKLGEDFLPLLPETIPFLAELLEDEEESVEKACKKSVQDIEKILGEPIQKYF